jgi:hypothetical protein
MMENTCNRIVPLGHFRPLLIVCDSDMFVSWLYKVSHPTLELYLSAIACSWFEKEVFLLARFLFWLFLYLRLTQHGRLPVCIILVVLSRLLLRKIYIHHGFVCWFHVFANVFLQFVFCTSDFWDCTFEENLDFLIDSIVDCTDQM